MTEAVISGLPGVPPSIHVTAVVASAVVRAARRISADLTRGRRLDAAVLRGAIEAAFCASDAAGVWSWFVLLRTTASLAPPMRLLRAVPFAADDTPRADAREDRLSRGRKIVERLGTGVGGAIVPGASRVMIFAQEAA